MPNISVGKEYAEELRAETAATRNCLERVPTDLFNWKPHEKSMNFGYLALLVSEIPKWITHMITRSEIDFATYEHVEIKTTAELVRNFDDNMKEALRQLEEVSNKALEEPFFLKNQGQVVFTASKKQNIGSSINHMVHHRGQLTVYLRLNNIAVPSIYGPSADDRRF